MTQVDNDVLQSTILCFYTNGQRPVGGKWPPLVPQKIECNGCFASCATLYDPIQTWKKVYHLFLSKISQLLKKIDNFKKIKQIDHFQKNIQNECDLVIAT